MIDSPPLLSFPFPTPGEVLFALAILPNRDTPLATLASVLGCPASHLAPVLEVLELLDLVELAPAATDARRPKTGPPAEAWPARLNPRLKVYPDELRQRGRKLHHQGVR
jgi:hypothetical protein